MSTSQNGWPSLAADSPRLHSWVIPGSNTRLRLRNGSAGFLLVHLALWFDHRIEDVDGPVLDDWGYAYRPVRGYSATLSNHSSGTAMDLNATKHLLGAEDTFSPEDERLIRQRVNRFFDDCIRWGGEYQGRKDEMHFEIDAPLAKCEQVARRLISSPRGRRILAANPGQRAVILS
jgi:hypothetical protein